MHRYQLDEFAIRGEVLKPIDVIRSATSTAARLFQREGELGVVAPGARADLLVVEGNPLEDLGIMREPERNLKLIVKDGVGLQGRAGLARPGGRSPGYSPGRRSVGGGS